MKIIREVGKCAEKQHGRRISLGKKVCSHVCVLLFPSPASNTAVLSALTAIKYSNELRSLSATPDTRVHRSETG